MTNPKEMTKRNEEPLIINAWAVICTMPNELFNGPCKWDAPLDGVITARRTRALAKKLIPRGYEKDFKIVPCKIEVGQLAERSHP